MEERDAAPDAWTNPVDPGDNEDPAQGDTEEELWDEEIEGEELWEEFEDGW